MPPLAASELEATLINRGDEHRLALNLEARDRPLSLQARIHLHGDAFSWKRWKRICTPASRATAAQWLPEGWGGRCRWQPWMVA